MHASTHRGLCAAAAIACLLASGSAVAAEAGGGEYRARHGTQDAIRAMTDRLSSSLSAGPIGVRRRWIAVAELESVGDEASNRRLGLAVSELISTYLVRD